MFKLVSNGAGAERVNVKFGRGSVQAIEVLEGLKIGDQIILSDMSNWDKKGSYPLEVNEVGPAGELVAGTKKRICPGQTRLLSGAVQESLYGAGLYFLGTRTSPAIACRCPHVHNWIDLQLLQRCGRSGYSIEREHAFGQHISGRNSGRPPYAMRSAVGRQE